MISNDFITQNMIQKMVYCIDEVRGIKIYRSLVTFNEVLDIIIVELSQGHLVL